MAVVHFQPYTSVSYRSALFVTDREFQDRDAKVKQLPCCGTLLADSFLGVLEVVANSDGA